MLLCHLNDAHKGHFGLIIYVSFPSIYVSRFQEAEDDCTEALNLDDRYIKAYSRRATARKELGKNKESMEGVLICKPYTCLLSKYKNILIFELVDYMICLNCRCRVCLEVGT